MCGGIWLTAIIELRDLKTKQFDDHNYGYWVNLVPAKEFAETDAKQFLIRKGENIFILVNCLLCKSE